jgi:tRNA(adenine34) deaminase
MKVIAPRLRTFCTQPAKVTVLFTSAARSSPQLCDLYIKKLILRDAKLAFYMEMSVNNDLFFMREALKEARAALERGEVPIGAVVVTGIVSAATPYSSGGKIIGRGHNLTETLTDATAHAEMQAITAASAELGGKYLNDCTLYVTVEPCVMCAGAMAWAQLGRLVYGAADPKRGYMRFGAPLLHPRTVVTSGVLADECGTIVSDFFKKLRD